MRIYIASHCKWAALYVKHCLVEHEVVSTWHDGEFLGMDQHSEHERCEIAFNDANEVGESDCVVLISANGKHAVKGGKFVEAGIALGLGKKVVVLGRRENMLMHHPSIVSVDNIHSLLGALR